MKTFRILLLWISRATAVGFIIMSLHLWVMVPIFRVVSYCWLGNREAESLVLSFALFHRVHVLVDRQTYMPKNWIDGIIYFNGMLVEAFLFFGIFLFLRIALRCAKHNTGKAKFMLLAIITIICCSFFSQNQARSVMAALSGLVSGILTHMLIQNWGRNQA